MAELIINIRRDIAELQQAQESSQKRIGQYQTVMKQTDTIRQGSLRLAHARTQFDALENVRQKYDLLNQQRDPLVAAIQLSRARLEDQIEGLRLRVESELSVKAAAEPELTSQLANAQSTEKQLQDQSQELAVLRGQAQSLATDIGKSKSSAMRYEAEGKELNLKLEILRRSDQENAVCPLCQTPLDQDSCARMGEAYKKEVEQKRTLFRKNRSHLAALEARQEEFDRELPLREKAIAEAHRESTVKIQGLQDKIQESKQAAQKLNEAKAQIDSASQSLNSAGYAIDEQVQLKQLDQRIHNLSYDDQARQTAYQQTQELQTFEDLERQLSQALESLPHEEERMTAAMDMLTRRTVELKQQNEKFEAATEAITHLPRLEMKLEESEQEIHSLEGQRESAVARQGYLKGQLIRRDELEEEETQGSLRLVNLQDDQSVYQELNTAFGRRGVQAMLIETVVPRLEEEANLLLGRMTDNRMHVKLETQRERRAGPGEPIETLEINVSDELGPRSYEMYSGGEAFRINLAMRIALSKVLAQRIGAPLPTLFIDEGFGTQDAAGRERILDVISAIQDDFEKIIVITHLDDIKDQFPVRIEVHKESEGSTFWLS